MYTVVDIETTGTGATGNRITEIALFRVEGERITDSFSSLVNPGCEIPPFITGLTGITTAMVRQAPPFEALADQIEAFTQGQVFVAHSVNFDYPIVKKEFERCGRTFSRKKLCTVRLSRSVFPGLRSYSLGKLCNSLDIPLTDRHRAAGDAKATALLLSRILAQPEGQTAVQGFLNARSQEATLPPHLPRETYERIPHAPGVYYFRDKAGRILYIGKAIDLKKRVLGHFYDASARERSLCRETAAIDFELSGSDLVALLMESAAIKTHFPPFNRAQKAIRPAYGLFSYPDQAGIRHLALNRLRKGQQAHKVFFSLADARAQLESVCTRFSLCAKYCHLQEGVEHCGHFRVPRCQGICRGEESVTQYNARVDLALDSLRDTGSHLLIAEQGRSPGEQAIVWMEGGQYRGYGFLPEDTGITHPEELEAWIQPQRHNPETQRILESYLSKHSKNVRRVAPLAP
ncbi:exonuclease domain-containing protein [Robiginitalea sp. M366]|uniref:exonuclease domain-containing protein n=1 Tax=Robiginitalea aestuariiviva TaxID=3036903 RepID=UPI00240E6C58|nr:exonuclease domain-containing protein [Robiginitalea aestuariiviva]MDG1572174.1 exonuclease domain-containing protein [Robiginitalea aestuariiviva]